MRMSSRYFATVRRVTWMPCDWRMRVICSSVNGLVGSSSSMSLLTGKNGMANLDDCLLALLDILDELNGGLVAFFDVVAGIFVIPIASQQPTVRGIQA